jgi:hypothetical protein
MFKNIVPTIISICSLFCACNTASNPGVKTYKDSQLHLQISYPKNWQFDSSNYAIREDLQGETDVYQEKLLIGYEVLPMKIEPDMYAKGVATQFKLIDTSLNQISFSNFTNTDFKSFKIVFEKQASDISKTIEYILVKDTLAYSIQCNTTKEAFAVHEPIFDSIINQIKFLK